MKKNKSLKIIFVIIIIIAVLCGFSYFFISKTHMTLANKNNEVIRNAGVIVNNSGVTISKDIEWKGTNTPENYQATFTLSEAEADYVIYYIEDLLEICKQPSKYSGKNIVLARTLDFNNEGSYKNYEDTSYGDINKNSSTTGIKDELTDREGWGFPTLVYDAYSINFYGNGNEIRNYYSTCTGMFYNLSQAKIYDLGITGDVFVDTAEMGVQNSTGVIAADAEECEFINCYSKVNISGGSEMGGIVGGAYGCRFINCYNEGTMTDGLYVGGIVGWGSENTIEKCYNKGTFFYEKNDNYASWAPQQGGIIGVSSNGGNKIIDCYNEGDITVNYYWADDKHTVAGGIIGSEYSENLPSVVINCYNTVNIISSNSAGGIAGIGNMKIYNSYNLGNVSVPSENRESYAGGITAINGFFTGNTYNPLTGGNKINNCYNSGAITGRQNYTGGIVGQAATGATIFNCYYSNPSVGVAIGTDTASLVSEEDIKTQTYTNTLNSNKDAITDVTDLETWVYNENEFPTFDIDYSADVSEMSTNIEFSVIETKTVEGNDIVTFSDLPIERNNKFLVYKVEETSAAKKNKSGGWDTLEKNVDYTMTDKNDLVTNTVIEHTTSNPTRNITVKKKWRIPETEAQNYIVTVRLIAVVGQTRTVVTDENDDEITKTIRGNNGTAIFENVPVYDGEDLIKYEAEEIRVQKSKGINEETGEEEFEDVPLDKFKTTYQTI